MKEQKPNDCLNNARSIVLEESNRKVCPAIGFDIVGTKQNERGRERRRAGVINVITQIYGTEGVR